MCHSHPPTLRSRSFADEGEWHTVDRVWTIRVGSDEPRLIHRRTMRYEISGRGLQQG